MAVDLEGIQCYAKTPQAILIGPHEESEPAEDEKFWIPLSQVLDTDLEKKGDIGHITLTDWIAKEKGIQEGLGV